MKKIICIMFMFVLLASFVTAQTQNTESKTVTNRFRESVIEKTDIDVDALVCCHEYGYGSNMVKVNERYQWRQQSQCSIEDGFVGGNKEVIDKDNCGDVLIKTTVQGLQNDVLRVRTQERAQHMQQVMEKVQIKRLEMLNKLDGLEIEEDESGNVQAEGERKAKLFGFISMNHRYRYGVNEQGEVERINRWNDFMFKDEENMK